MTLYFRSLLLLILVSSSYSMASSSLRCPAGFYFNGTTCTRDCVAGNRSTQNCSITNGTGIQSRTCGSTGQWGAFGSCSVTSCNAGFYSSAGTCRQDCAPNSRGSQACGITYGTGTQSRTCSANGQWGSFGSCTLVSCNPGFYSSGGICKRDCVANTQSSQACSAANGTGTQSKTCSATGQWGAFGGCTASRCNAGYYLSNGACIQDCSPRQTSAQACSIANGTGTQSRTCSASGQWGAFGSCTVASCAAGFYSIGGVCKRDCTPSTTGSQPCGIAYGTGTQSRTCSASGQWGAFGSCTLVSCNPGFYSSGGSCKRDCVATTQTSQACSAANGTGTQSKTCSATGQWGAVGSCVVSRCNSGFYLSNGACVQDCSPKQTSAQACSIANGTGTQSRTCSASGQWGAFGSCTVASCAAGFYSSGGVCKRDCTPNTIGSQPCGITFGTGTQSRTCSANGQWGSFGSCNLVSCNPGFYSNGGVCKRDCVANIQTTSQACSVSNGTGTQSKTCSATGQWGAFGSCVVSRCNPGYYSSGGSCVQNCVYRQVASQPCEVANAIGTQSRTCSALGQWGAYGICSLVSCKPGFYLSGGACKQDCTPNTTASQACSLPNGNGTQLRTCDATGKWGSFGSCEINTCSAGFYSNGGVCKQDCSPNTTASQACSTANGAGTQSRTCSESGQWGAFGSCAVNTCNSGFYLNNGVCVSDGIQISNQPSSQSAVAGVATFSVQAQTKSGRPVGIQWQAKGPGETEWKNIRGANSQDLPLTKLKSSNHNTSYRAIISAVGFSDVVSNPVNLTVSNNLQLLSQPLDNQLANNGSVKFEFTAKSTQRISVQWQKKIGNSDYSDIPGENKVFQGLIGLWRSSYSIEDVTKEVAGTKYRAQISMGAEKLYTNPVGFRILSTPTINDFSPKQGNPSTLITIKGANFDGVTAISIGGVPVAYSSVKSSQEILVVPGVNTSQGAGAIMVTNSMGIGTSRDSFNFSNPFCNPNIGKDRALLISSLDVVNDPVRTQFVPGDSNQGSWSFAGLMSRIAPAGSDVEDFVQSWLNLYMTPHQVNGFAVGARDISMILESWPKNDAGKLDLSKAPFRLLAISNRLDLRSPVLADKKAGSLIFIFGLFDQTPGDSFGQPLKMSVMIEFDLRTEIHSLMDWSFKWYNLGLSRTTDENYKKQLEKLTNEITLPNPSISKTNGSAFSAIRTSENMSGKTTELREFGLNSVGQLVQSPLKQTPDVSFNSERKQELIQWINDNLSAVGSNKFEMKPEFLAGSASMPSAAWLTDTDLSPRVRSNFAMATCTGCHQSETQNSGVHIANRKPDERSKISPFLTNELLSREYDFKTLLMEMFCGQ